MTRRLDASEDMVFSAACMHDLTALTSLVEQACRQVGADGDRLFSIRLAVEEVFTNILDYGYKGGTGPVTIRIDAQPEQVRISFADAAPLFDPSTVAAPKLDLPLEERAVGGWGWHFVRQSVDRVEWQPREEGGNLFTLVKSFDGVDALAKLAADAFDLVLLDIMMPGMDGYEVLERLKADEHFATFPSS